MAQSTDPRRLLLSWRPTPGNENVKKWLDRFKLRIGVECRLIVVVDSHQPGQDRAGQRDQRDRWTDFVSVLTLDYVKACEDEPEHELLSWALPLLRDEIAGVRFWAVRLDVADPRGWGIRVGSKVYEPWRESQRWHFLPDILNPEHLDIFAVDLEKQIERECVSRIEQHVVDCAVCRGDAAAQVEPPGGGILHRLQRLFGRP